MGLFSFDTFHGFLISTNIFQRMNKIGELLQKEDADIIMLQEVHTYFILNILKKKLSTHPYVAYKRFLYGPKGGLVIFSKHPIEKTEYTDYKTRGSLFNKSFVAHIIQNGVLSCKLKNMSLSILNTYMTPNMDYDHSKANRYAHYSEAQIRQLAIMMKTAAAKGDTVLTCGDFNTDKNSYSYTIFLDLSEATDVFAQETIPTKHQEFYPSHVKVDRLDHMFLSTKKKILETKHIFTKKVPLANGTTAYLSDHMALEATIQFDKL